MSATKIIHFSDVLCVWAYVGQVRMDELHQEFGGQIAVDYRFLPVFGVARDKLAARWQDKGGLAAYGTHVQGIGSQFAHVSIHPEVWQRVAPWSSMPAHLFLCALRDLERRGEVAAGALRAATWAVRRAFFQDLLDIGDARVLLALGEQLGVAPALLSEHIAGGRAHAELAADLDLARELDVRVSPSLVLNEGRQRLNGNVGYRVIAANVRELLERPREMMSWC